MNTNVYISGPITGYDIEERRRTFARHANYIWDLGFHPVNPLEDVLHADEDWNKHMKRDLKLLSECGYIFLLPEWYTSKGSLIEVMYALKAGIRRFVYSGDSYNSFSGNWAENHLDFSFINDKGIKGDEDRGVKSADDVLVRAVKAASRRYCDKCFKDDCSVKQKMVCTRQYIFGYMQCAEDNGIKLKRV